MEGTKKDYIVDMLDTMTDEEIVSMMLEYRIINVRELMLDTIYSLNEESESVDLMYNFLVNEY